MCVCVCIYIYIYIYHVILYIYTYIYISCDIYIYVQPALGGEIKEGIQADVPVAWHHLFFLFSFFVNLFLKGVGIEIFCSFFGKTIVFC